MKHTITVAVALLLIAPFTFAQGSFQYPATKGEILQLYYQYIASQSGYQYPATKKEPVVDHYFGTAVSDNYRWMENMNSDETKTWFKAQADFTNAWLDSIEGRAAFTESIMNLYRIPSAAVSGIIKRGNRYFYRKRPAGESVTKIYWRNGKSGTEKVLVDPTCFATGKSITISYFSPSPDGSHVAFGIAENGKELSTIHIVTVATGTLLPETLYPSWFGISGWTADSKGFLYTRNRSDNVNDSNLLLNTNVLYHKIGTDESSDVEIFSKEKYPALGIQSRDLLFVNITDDNTYLIASLRGVRRELHTFIAPARELLQPTIHWQPLTKPSDEITKLIVKGNDLYLLSHKGAPRYQLLHTAMAHPDMANAKTIVAEAKDKIESIAVAKDVLYLTYSDGINHTVKRFNVATKKLSSVALPFSGTVSVSVPDEKENSCIIEVTSWKLPPVKFEYDGMGISKSLFQPPVLYPGTEDVVVEEVDVKSHDGVLVPLSIFYNKNVKRDGNAVCIMSGYGAYGISNYPFFHPAFLATLNKGVVITMAHVRGGGERGEAWHHGGFKTTKPNTWKDFIACAEYLIEHRYTSAKKLAGHGASAGGITIGRAITERPDLFGAAINEVGINNMLRFEQSPNGPNNAQEFGTVKDSIECRALLEMDALHHVQKGVAYPAVINTVGINDPRVAAWETGKFAAALQHASTSGKPVLLRVDYNSGHFTEDRIIAAKRFGDVISFVLWQCGHPDFQSKKPVEAVSYINPELERLLYHD